MTKKKLSFKKWLSMLLTAVMLVAALPISAFAAPASGIPANMLDNVYLDALAYTGYNVQAQKDDGTIFIKTGSSVSASIRSGIGYGTGPSGLKPIPAAYRILPDSVHTDSAVPPMSAMFITTICRMWRISIPPLCLAHPTRDRQPPITLRRTAG